jgi:peptidoglycan/LPS O-acetylase OafA/YrhL
MVVRRRDRCDRALPRWLPMLAVPLVPSLGVLAYLGALHTDTPLGFIPDMATLCYMGGFFAWGWIVHARPGELDRYARRVWAAGLLALGALAIVIVTLARARSVVAPPPLYAIAASAVFTVAVMVFALGGGVRYLVRRHAVLELTADASFTLYILHLPTAVLLQIVLANAPIFGPIKFLAIVAMTLVVGVGLHVVVRRWQRGRRSPPVSAARARA